MGFTSTQTQALGPGNLPSFETLRGVTDQWPAGYFAAGCAMHLSHLYLDLATWYGKSRYTDARRDGCSSRSPAVPATRTLTIPNGPAQVATRATDRSRTRPRARRATTPCFSRRRGYAADTIDNYGRLQKKGTAIPIREDFNTLDDPFAWLPGDTALRQGNTPGLHFVAFVPSHLAFHKARFAMDGYNPDGTKFKMTTTGTKGSDFPVTGRAAGINSIMSATHRQNYVIPPRKNRSFPLAELLT